MIKVLLLQFRGKEYLARRELNSFYSAFAEEDIKVVIDNVSAIKDKLNFKIANLYDVIILGGSEFSFGSEDVEVTKRILNNTEYFLKYVLEKDNIPCLGVCFGHQLIGKIMGGNVVRHKEAGKAGAYEIMINNSYAQDKFFDGIPKSFYAAYIHRDALVEIPKEAVSMAKGYKCDFPILKYGSCCYSTQFHPELSKERLRVSLDKFPEYISEKDKRVDDLLNNTDNARKILRNIAKFALERKRL